MFGALRADVLGTSTRAANVSSVRSIEAHGFRLVREELTWNAGHGRDLPMHRDETTRAEVP